ncbi:hypothetical protein LTR99_002598 [Exophiala xenobiotica]|uniref:Uncharacterized protein n=1 Tax=Vermiconidia calcicola TaxID=1690605 RepID=A0AAV9QHF0_9PEZI|nr:hypothetical protein LTR41_004376 [Exophiala xenobiotica]KAK5537053.1 hypothetical protein LTR23_007750 [Chaetothyriales sp. CCFEE 6169]KAK5542065.1 hypothetical protein LTR25_001950 [Vermiconidia calcicola]KAK5225616.1 hypothetical protein LTR72_003519 [Exophiala xenobiotica]KAK5298436.1 hypothetical protein LTR14_002287 [Exophiala xenobiotica]
MVLKADPYYNRKPVPDDLIKDVGTTGLTPDQEYWNRERKYSVNGVDVRRFSNSKKGGMEPQDDPYYGRKRVSVAEIHNVGETGLTPEQEYSNRERKYSVGGVDVRKFSTSKKGGLEPQSDPYYGRKRVSSQYHTFSDSLSYFKADPSTLDAEIAGVGETGMTPAEQYEVRERKQSLFQLSTDPFENLAGRHRTSISGVASSASAAATRRRSSAVAPDVQPGAPHSGYHGENLATIESRTEGPPVNFGETNFGGRAGSASTSDTLEHGTASTSNATGTSSTSGRGHAGEHTVVHDAVTVGHNHNEILGQDPDQIAPHEIR